MSPAIAIIGMACEYPDARSPRQLWDNVIAQRRAFRRLPPERLRLDDYWSANPEVADSTYLTQAAVIEGYEFDRVGFRVAGSTFRAADLAHWLALDVAARALADAGFPDATGLPRRTTGVVLGNSLTGEFSRANALRLRWPYVRRVIEPSLRDAGWPPERRRALLAELEARYKAPFPPPGDETLAGSLSNTIAGRICNYYDLQGGGYTVDGACAASLLAVATACSSLVAEDLDVVLAGGVDLSLDPFELVGFARVGALAPETMRVYDAHSAGFWPGEGCGLVALMRHEDALAQGRHVYAVIRGWGISSDGTGGLTRPELDGQVLALERAYQRAGFGIDSVGYFEGHGTGTSVGDAVELQALTAARRSAAPSPGPAAIGSIKANIGHTKAAAGIAGLLKATLAVDAQVLPPTTGCGDPHPQLHAHDEPPALRVLDTATCWPPAVPLRAGVSAMGFGGINTHVVLESQRTDRQPELDARTRALAASPQDVELFLFDGANALDLLQQVDGLLDVAASLAWSDLADLAAAQHRQLAERPMRAALVAARPGELAEALATLRRWLTAGEPSHLDTRAGVFLGTHTRAPRIGFLFPGQGSPSHPGGGLWRRRFAAVDALYAQADLPVGRDGRDTALAQPAIATASLAGLRVLQRLGLQADVAVGHSLGELAAFHWAGAFDEPTLLRIARLRGRAMAELAVGDGGMASIGVGPQLLGPLLTNSPVVIASLNGPEQTVVAGPVGAVERVIEHARAKDWAAQRLPVSHAFHSPLVAPAVPALQASLAREAISGLQRRVVSTVTGAELEMDADIRALLRLQVTNPVRFYEAARCVAQQTDLLIEVGPGHVLSGLVSSFSAVPTIATDTSGPSLRGLLAAAGTAFALGAPLAHAALFDDRCTRPFEVRRPRLFANPCEQAPSIEDSAVGSPSEPPAPLASPSGSEPSGAVATDSPLELFRGLVAARAELPVSAVYDSSRLLSDLHLNSITVSQLVTEATRRLGAQPSKALAAYADATVADVATALAELPPPSADDVDDADRDLLAGVDTWVRAFTVELVEHPLPTARPPVPGATTDARWTVLAHPANLLADVLVTRLAALGASPGVVVCLSPEPDASDVRRLLEGARRARAMDAIGAHFVLVQHGGGGAAFARTLHLELPAIATCVIDVPQDDPRAPEWVAAEIVATPHGYAEAHYDRAGRRRAPVLRLLPTDTTPAAHGVPLADGDVLLVSGGGKGIAAESAFALATASGARLALVGRSEPRSDPELAATLERLTRAGVRFVYRSADVQDAAALRVAVAAIEGELGPITGVLHGAGLNQPRPLATMDLDTLEQTLAPKVQGMHNVLAAVDTSRLRLVVAFGSIIARSGLWGEAHYGLANEWLRRSIEGFQAAHPTCRCLVIEWSVWSDVGMGARLGSLEGLVRHGVTPIPPDAGVALLQQLLSQPTPTSVVAMGRYPALPTLAIERRPLPLLRFLERPRVHFPGIELVVDAEVSVDTDPYVSEHVLQGERLFPAVLGLEAMAQVAMALLETADPPLFEAVHFERPVVVPGSGATTLRLAALVRAPGRVDVVLRCAATGFQVDHFRATCRPASARARPAAQLERVPTATGRAPIDPARHLYGRLLFHTGRFQRLAGYRRLRAKECLADITAGDGGSWFGTYLPPDLVLGDPGLRDAGVHAVQACIPHAVVLPTSVDRLWCWPWGATQPAQVWARERAREGDSYVYDLVLAGSDGVVREHWQGLRLRALAGARGHGGWPLPLLTTHVERRLDDLAPGALLGLSLESSARRDRRAQSDRAIREATGGALVALRRADGKPELVAQPGLAVSTSHTGHITLGVLTRSRAGCDVEEVTARPVAVWRDLLGDGRFRLVNLIVRETAEDVDSIATRVWAAGESLLKAGAPLDAPLVLRTVTDDGWVILGAGTANVATCVAALDDGSVGRRIALAVLIDGPALLADQPQDQAAPNGGQGRTLAQLGAETGTGRGR